LAIGARDAKKNHYGLALDCIISLLKTLHKTLGIIARLTTMDRARVVELWLVNHLSNEQLISEIMEYILLKAKMRILNA